MLTVPNLADGFPSEILFANLVATFPLGLVTALPSVLDARARGR
jgi:fluoride ion exporter CrcB/FEX